MQEITLELFLEREAKHPGRRCFAQHSGIGQGRDNPYFRLPFPNGIRSMFEAETGLRLREGDGPDNWYCYLKTDADLEAAQNWEASQGTRVFLRDCLSCSVALDHNFIPQSDPLEYTTTGQLEHDAKICQDKKAITDLVRCYVGAILSMAPYAETGLITAVPGRKGKPFDLPSVLAAAIASELGLKNVTEHFSYLGDKGQLKSTAYDDRWTQLENAGLNMTEEGKTIISGQPVILVDDKYQSGVTANYVAMVLQQHGAADIYGLYAVKTLGDKDNS